MTIIEKAQLKMLLNICYMS